MRRIKRLSISTYLLSTSPFFPKAIVAVETLHPLLSSSHASDDALAFEDVWKAAVTILLQMGGWIQEDFGDVAAGLRCMGSVEVGC